MDVPWKLSCVDCQTNYPGLEIRYRCDCGGTLDVIHNWDHLDCSLSLEFFDRRLSGRKPADRSGVWRFRELILPLPEEHIVTNGEGNTTLYNTSQVAEYTGLDSLYLKHEGENPTASFKDRGMTVGVSQASSLGMKKVACAHAAKNLCVG